MYENGQGLTKDHGAAMKWCEKSANQGNDGAQFGIALRYDTGGGVRQDYGEAIAWYRRAAERGNAKAQNNLTRIYEDGYGRGVGQDFVEAHKWFALSAAQFPPAMSANIQRALNNCQLAAARLTPSQVAEAHRLASTWKPRARFEGR